MIAPAKTPGGSKTVKCLLCHEERVANAHRCKGHLLHMKDGWDPCAGIPPPAPGEKHSAEEVQMAAEVLAEAQRRMQEVKDSKEAAKQAASRKRQLTAVLATAATSQRQQKALEEVYARKNKNEVDGALADFIYSSGIPFHTVESPYFRTLLSAVGSFGAAYKPPGRRLLRTRLLDEVSCWGQSDRHLQACNTLHACKKQCMHASNIACKPAT